MTTDDILRMAREVADKDKVDPVSGPPGEEFVTMTPEELERFATLVAAAEREAVRLNATVPVGAIKRAIEALTYCEALNRNIEHQKLRSLNELHNILSAAPAAPQLAQQNAAEKAEPMVNPASAQFEAMHARGIVWISTIAAAKLVQKTEPADAAMLAEKDALLRQALEALEGFAKITNDSQGVAGYHLNGSTAAWHEFDEVDAASNTIKAIRNHLGVKND